MAITIFTMLMIYLVHISSVDIKKREISNFAPIIIMMSAPLLTQIGLTDRLISGVSMFFLLYVLCLSVGLGMGDVKLVSSIAFTFGFAASTVILLLSLVSALLITKISKQNELPLAPFITSSVAIVYIMEVILYA